MEALNALSAREGAASRLPLTSAAAAHSRTEEAICFAFKLSLPRPAAATARPWMRGGRRLRWRRRRCRLPAGAATSRLQHVGSGWVQAGAGQDARGSAAELIDSSSSTEHRRQGRTGLTQSSSSNSKEGNARQQLSSPYSPPSSTKSACRPRSTIWRGKKREVRAVSKLVGATGLQASR